MDDPRKPHVARAKLLSAHGSDLSACKWLAFADSYRDGIPRKNGKVRAAIRIYVEQCELLAAEAARRETKEN